MELKYSTIDKNIAKPIFKSEKAACFDLRCRKIIEKEMYIEYYLNICVEIPNGYVGLIMPRSNISKKNSLLINSIGVIDPDYRGELKIRLLRLNNSKIKNHYTIGERCAQMRIAYNPKITLVETDNKSLTKTKRNQNGFGSTGNK